MSKSDLSYPTVFIDKEKEHMGSVHKPSHSFAVILKFVTFVLHKLELKLDNSFISSKRKSL